MVAVFSSPVGDSVVADPDRPRHLVLVPSDRPDSPRGRGAVPAPARRLVVVPTRRHPPAVYRRRRVAVLVVLGLGVLGLGVLGAWLVVRAFVGDGVGLVPPAARSAPARVWVVRPGDTLWSIALASGDKGELRPLVDQLSAEVDGRPLQVGELISVP